MCSYPNAAIFAAKQLETAVKALENDEPLHRANCLSDLAQRFLGAADFARDGTTTSALLLTLGIVLHSIAHDSTSWNVVLELHAGLKRESELLREEPPF